MTNGVYRIKQYGTLALTKDSLLFVSLQTNQWPMVVFPQINFSSFVLCSLPPLLPSALISSPSAVVAIVVLVWPDSSVRCSRRLFNVWYLILVQSWAISVIIDHPVTSSQTAKAVSINPCFLCKKNTGHGLIKCFISHRSLHTLPWASLRPLPRP
jgi:hypothetical protein